MTQTSFTSAVYAAVRRIPKGSVATYGQIAAYVGHPRAARAVGTALARLPRRLEAIIPWQRVIAAQGISRARDDERAFLQRDMLESEGVDVRRSGRIDLMRFQWAGSQRNAKNRRVNATDASSRK